MRKRLSSSSTMHQLRFIEIGGITELQPEGTDQIAFYRLNSYYFVSPTVDYIKLPQRTRYVNCAVHEVSLGLYTCVTLFVNISFSTFV